MTYIYEHPKRRACTDVAQMLWRKFGIRAEVEPSLEIPRRFCVAVDEEEVEKAKRAIEGAK